MIINYLKIFLRKIKKYYFFYLLTYLSLAIGIVSAILIIQYVYKEFNYDKFHHNYDKIYRVAYERLDDKEFVRKSVRINNPIGFTVNKEFEEIENFSRIFKYYVDAKYGDKKYREENTYFVDSTFLEMFNFPFIDGDKTRLLNGPNTVVLTKSISKKYFGNEDPIGKIINIYFERNIPMEVVGIIDDLKSNTHFNFDILVSLTSIEQIWGKRWTNSRWVLENLHTYISIKKGFSVEKIEDIFDLTVQKYLEEDMKKRNYSIKYFLQPLTQIHTSSNLQNELSNNSNKLILYIILFGSIFMLVTSWIIYINFVILIAVDRAKEIGLRKIMGGRKKHIFSQFAYEAIFTNLICLILAFVLYIVFAPHFYNLISVTQGSLIGTGLFWLVLSSIFITSILVCTFYPSLAISSIKPINVIHGKFGGSKKGVNIRRALLLLQFVILIIFTSGLMTIYRQINFMKDKDIGINIEKTLVIKAQSTTDENIGLGSFENINAFKQEILKNPIIKDVSVSNIIPGKTEEYYGRFKVEGSNNDKQILIPIYRVDDDFLSYFGVEFICGRDFSSSSPHDMLNYGDNSNLGCILDEEGVKRFGFKSPEDAIGKRIVEDFGLVYHVRGVVKNHNIHTIKEGYRPMLYYWWTAYPNYLFIRLNNKNTNLSLPYIKDVCLKYFPDLPFSHFWLDEYYNNQFQNEKVFGTINLLLFIIIMIICSIGLFGISAYLMSLRTKEIAIRNVLGASLLSNIKLFAKEYIVLVLISYVIAIPIAMLSLTSWLENYPYKVSLGWWFYLIPIILLLLITNISIGYNMLKISFSSSVESLRNE